MVGADSGVPAGGGDLSGNGVVTIATGKKVDEAVQAIQDLLKARGVKLFALIDHSGEAEAAGMDMPRTKLLIFGNPKAGTPVMLASPTIAIDLPLKVLVYEDSAGKVWISWNAPEYLQTRHGVPAELAQNIAAVEGLVTAAGLRES